MGGLDWSWPIFGVGGVAGAVMTFITYRAAVHRTGRHPWKTLKCRTAAGKVWLYWSLAFFGLPVGALAAVLAVNMPAWLIAAAAGAVPQSVLVLLGAGTPDENE
jgi:hypothetical protein